MSLIAVPVYLDTNEDPSQLLHQWARTYHYGHQALPTLSVGICLLDLYAAAKRRGANRPWVVFALAGLLTVVMVPFTWLIMVPTNNELFRLEALAKFAGTQDRSHGLSPSGVRELIIWWAQLHFARSLFPMAGAILGAHGAVR